MVMYSRIYVSSCSNSIYKYVIRCNKYYYVVNRKTNAFDRLFVYNLAINKKSKLVYKTRLIYINYNIL